MKKSNLARRGHQDPGQLCAQPDKVGWIRKFYGRGIFREIWKNRFVILRGDHLYISEKEVKDERRAVEVCDLLDYERSEELRKLKSRSKKNHSRFTLMRHQQPGDMVPSLVFLAVSPEEKESWVNALNIAIVKAKNRVLDEVTVAEDSVLVHPTRERARIPLRRRLPTRGHLLAVASTSSDGSLTLDLVRQENGSASESEQEEPLLWGGRGYPVDPGHGGTPGRQRAGTDVSKLRASAREARAPTGSLPRGNELSWARHGAKPPPPQAQFQAQSRTPQPGKRPSLQGRGRCASMDEVLTSSRPLRSRVDQPSRGEAEEEEERAPQPGPGLQAEPPPVGQLQSLIAQKMQRAQELLEEIRLQELQRAKGGGGGYDSAHRRGVDSPRLHHLRGSDPPRSRSPGSASCSSSRSRSGEAPRLRGRDSPRLRRNDSPRATPRATPRRSRSKGGDSPAPKASDPLSRHRDHDPPPPAPRSPRAGEDVESPCLSGPPPPRLAGSDSPIQRGGASPGVAAKASLSARAQDTPGLTGCNSSPEHSDWPVRKTTEPLSPPSGGGGGEEEGEGEERGRRAEAERLLREAVSSWREAQEVLEEVRELQTQTLRRQRRSSSLSDTPTSPSHDQGEAGERGRSSREGVGDPSG